VFDAGTGALLSTMDNPCRAALDSFGVAVAVSGNTVVVGSYLDDTGANDSGQVYVFNASSGALLTTLNNPSPGTDDYFGYSVAVSGNTVVVGAYQDDTGATDSGQAYVFNAVTGALVATLNNPSPATGDFFGYSVAISGNLVVIGAYSDNTGAT